MKLQSSINLIIISLLLSSCGVGLMSSKYNTTKFKVSPTTLEVHGDKVKVNIEGNFPEKYFAKKATLEFTPILSYGDNQTKLKSIIVQGENAEGGEATIFFEPGGNFKYTDEISYDPKMKISTLTLEAVAKSNDQFNDRTVKFETITLANGIKTTSKRIIDNDIPKIANHGYETETILSESAVLYFLVNQSNIRTTEKTDEDIKKLKNFINSGNEIHSIEIKSYASPEGSVKTNNKVSKNRLASTENYTKKLLRKLKVNSELFTIKSFGEDWQGFNMLMKDSRIKDKKRITKIVNSISDLEEREMAIRDMAELYDAIEKDILPQLRKAQVTVKSYQPKKSKETIKRLSTESPDSLSVEELLYSASIESSDLSKIKIYESVKKIYNDWRAFNNIACIHITNKEYSKASAELKNSPFNTNEINENLAIIASVSGNYKEANTLFSNSNANEKNIALNNLRKGDYKKASRFFKGKKHHNAALSHLMAGKSNVLCDEKTAECYYLNAIIDARKNNDTGVLENLANAIKLKQSFKIDAKNDLEFKGLISNQSFINLVN